MSVFKDGSSEVTYFKSTESGTEELQSQQISRERPKLSEVNWPNTKIGATKITSVYSEEETDKDGLYRAIWGEHYRPLYSREFEFPVLYLDTIPGNLEVLGAGGGHQSRSLGFKDDEDHEYTLRALKKKCSAIPANFSSYHPLRRRFSRKHRGRTLCTGFLYHCLSLRNLSGRKTDG